MTEPACACACHSNRFASCSIRNSDVGCGPGCGQDARTGGGACITGCLTPMDENGNQYPQRAARGLMCKPCAGKLNAWLRDIDVDYHLLPMVMIPGEGGFSDSKKPKKAAESPTPVRLDVVALTDDGRGGAAREPGDELWFEGCPDIPAVLSVLHEKAEQLRGDLDPSRDPKWDIEGHTVHGEITYLLTAFDRMLEAVWVDEAAAEIRVVRDALLRAHGVTRVKPLGECMTVECGGTVWPSKWGLAPQCAKCKRVYAGLDQARLELSNRTSA
jgi:hypothetical protein